MKKSIILALILTGFLVFSGPSIHKASAVTIEDLQAQIQILIKIITQLQQQLLLLIQNQTKTQSCNSLSGKYSMTYQEAINIFKNSECKNLGDPNKLSVDCNQCDPKKEYGEFHYAIYGEDTSLLDRAFYTIGQCIVNVQNKRAYINKGPALCTGRTDVGYSMTIVCAMQNTPQEGWYYVEGPDSDPVRPEIKLLKLTKCSNCQISCSYSHDKANYIDSCTGSIITSYGGEYRCDAPLGVPPKDPNYIKNLIETKIKPIGTCGWCGNSCIRKTSGMYCPDIAPPVGVVCQEVNGVCTTVPTGTKYSCQTVVGTIPTNNYSTCIPDFNGTFNSLEECQKVCGQTTCTDSDGGNNIYTKGTVTYNGATYTDECAYCTGACPPPPQPCPPSTCGAVKEYYCQNGVMQNTTTVCPSGFTCQDGACKIIPTTPTFLPDLAITNITSDRGDVYVGQSQIISATEKNIGNASAGSHQSVILGDGATSPVTGDVAQCNTLLNGYGFVFSGSYTCTSPGYHILTVKADWFNQVQESNENNNSSNIVVNCLAITSSSTDQNLPDLTISDLTCSPTSLTIGQSSSCTITVANNGSGNASLHTLEAFSINKGLTASLYSINGTLTAGEISRVSFSWTCTQPTTAIRAIVDPTNIIQESNENNNWKEIAVNCTAPSSNLTISCDSGAANDTAKVGDYVAFFALPYGGSGTYSYSWTGDVTGSTPTVGTRFTTTGTKTAYIKVIDSTGATATASCSVSIINQTSFLETLQNQLSQLSDLVKQLSASLIGIIR